MCRDIWKDFLKTGLINHYSLTRGETPPSISPGRLASTYRWHRGILRLRSFSLDITMTHTTLSRTKLLQRMVTTLTTLACESHARLAIFISRVFLVSISCSHLVLAHRTKARPTQKHALVDRETSKPLGNLSALLCEVRDGICAHLVLNTVRLCIRLLSGSQHMVERMPKYFGFNLAIL